MAKKLSSHVLGVYFLIGATAVMAEGTSNPHAVISCEMIDGQKIIPDLKEGLEQTSQAEILAKENALGDQNFPHEGTFSPTQGDVWAKLTAFHLELCRWDLLARNIDTYFAKENKQNRKNIQKHTGNFLLYRYFEKLAKLVPHSFEPAREEWGKVSELLQENEYSDEVAREYSVPKFVDVFATGLRTNSYSRMHPHWLVLEEAEARDMRSVVKEEAAIQLLADIKQQLEFHLTRLEEAKNPATYPLRQQMRILLAAAGF